MTEQLPSNFFRDLLWFYRWQQLGLQVFKSTHHPIQFHVAVYRMSEHKIFPSLGGTPPSVLACRGSTPVYHPSNNRDYARSSDKILAYLHLFAWLQELLFGIYNVCLTILPVLQALV